MLPVLGSPLDQGVQAGMHQHLLHLRADMVCHLLKALPVRQKAVRALSHARGSRKCFCLADVQSRLVSAYIFLFGGVRPFRKVSLHTGASAQATSCLMAEIASRLSLKSEKVLKKSWHSLAK